MVDEKQIAIVVMMKQKKKKVAVAIRETEKRKNENWGEVKMAVGNCNIFYLLINLEAAWVEWRFCLWWGFCGGGGSFGERMKKKWKGKRF